MSLDTLLSAIDHFASIVTLLTFPLAVAGYLAMRNLNKLVGLPLLTCGLLAYGIDVCDRFGVISLSKDPKTFIFSDASKPIQVTGRTFDNQRVPLDGYEYSHCIFNNVTFLYNGVTPVRIDNAKLSGFNRLETDNKAIDNATYIYLFTKKIDITAELHFVGPSDAQRPAMGAPK